jgi:lipid-A-disaccharide synthase
LICKVLFVAGDLSGDVHSALLMREVARRQPSWQQFAVGGRAMREAGATMLGDSSGCGVIGVVPALQLVPRLLRLQRRVLDWVRRERPEAVVLCDWGAFNARLLRPLQRFGVPVLYYFRRVRGRRRARAG